MPVVQMPDGTLVDMPDNPTPEQLQALHRVAGSGPGESAKEVLRVGAKATQSGLAALPGLIGDAGMFTARKILSLPFLQPRGVTPPGQGDPLYERLMGSKFGDVTKAIETAGGAISQVEPKTPAGKVAGNIGASIVSNMSAPGAGSLAAKAGMGAAAGGGAETAGALFDDSPVAKVLGALLGAGGFGMASRALRPNAKELIQDSTSHVSPEDWQVAAGRQAVQQANNIPSLASQNVPNSTLPEIVALANTNPKVGPGLKKAVEGSQDSAADAVNAWTRQHLPLGKGLDQGDVLNEAQAAAEKALAKARERAGTVYGMKVPDGLNDSHLDKTRFDAMVTALKNKITEYGPTSEAGQALQKFIDSKLFEGAQGGGSAMQREMNVLAGQEVAQKPVTRMAWLNQLYKDMNQLGQADGYKGLPVRDIRQIMKSFTPEYDPARTAWRQAMENDYAVSAKGLTGELANYKGGQSWDKNTVTPGMLDKIFGGGRDNTLALQRLAADIGEDQVGALLREHISRTLGNTVKETKSGAGTLQTPADFVSSLAGNSTAKKNIETALQIAAKGQGTDPAATAQGFWKLIDALNTTKNLKLPDMVDTGVMQDIAGKNMVSTAIAPRLNVHRYFRVGASTKTYQDIADIVTSPDGLKKLEQIAQEKDPQRVRQAALAVLFQAQQAANGQENGKPPRIMIP